MAMPGERVAVRGGEVALALPLAVGSPPARFTATGAGCGVTAAVGAAGAAELAQLSPSVGVTGAAPALSLANPTGVARAALLAVVAPVLSRAGGAAICTEEARFAAAQPRSHAHFIRPAGVLPFA